MQLKVRRREFLVGEWEFRVHEEDGVAQPLYEMIPMDMVRSTTFPIDSGDDVHSKYKRTPLSQDNLVSDVTYPPSPRHQVPVPRRYASRVQSGISGLTCTLSSHTTSSSESIPRLSRSTSRGQTHPRKIRPVRAHRRCWSGLNLPLKQLSCSPLSN